MDKVYNSYSNFIKISEKCHDLQIRLLNLKFHKIEKSTFGHKFYLGKSTLESEFFASLGKIREQKIQEQDLKPLLDEIKLDIDPYV